MFLEDGRSSVEFFISVTLRMRIAEEYGAGVIKSALREVCWGIRLWCCIGNGAATGS